MNPTNIQILGSIGDESLKTSHSVLEATARILANNNLVEKTYIQSILNREKTFPTGLDFKSYGIAIPHTEPIHVKHGAILVNLLPNPVNFHHMANPSKIIAVDIILMLALKDKDQHLQYLTALLKIFQDEEKAKTLLESSSDTELTSTFENILKEEIK